MEKVIEAIAKLSGKIVQMEDAAKEQFNFKGLTLIQMHYLETINQLINPSLTELATEMKLTKPTVKVAVDRLIEKEYVYKVRSDEDKRSAHLHLTEKGKLINQMHDYAHRRLAELIIKNLQQNDLELFTGLIEKFVNQI
jgi:DNA-binding MarR family transcriptional regulator